MGKFSRVARWSFKELSAAWECLVWRSNREEKTLSDLQIEFWRRETLWRFLWTPFWGHLMNFLLSALAWSMVSLIVGENCSFGFIHKRFVAKEKQILIWRNQISKNSVRRGKKDVKKSRISPTPLMDETWFKGLEN